MCRFLQAGLSKSEYFLSAYMCCVTSKSKITKRHTCVCVCVCALVYMHIQNRHMPEKANVKLYKRLLYKKLNCFPCIKKAFCYSGWLGRPPLKTHSSDKLVEIYLYRISGVLTLNLLGVLLKANKKT